jgi:NAD(P)-dependent dehydrogenase (short-subunit alcohol dehydrogenase family)/acyl dehydratase/putative sterol carrier protein
MNNFKNKVVVITGAGNGIGRQYALHFAREGAKVVVNDLGGARDGEGGSQKAADLVVDEIQKLGGEAVASYDSVSSAEGADAIVGKALSAFGRLDVIVNNAGILRDKTMLKMDEGMFDSVIAVHLKGTWLCTRAAARVFAEQGEGGRVINTTSVAGLKGNFGQTNYAAAKAGIYGLSLSAAQELAKHRVTVNCVAPIAKTRMTEELAVVSEELKPEHVAPVVLFLASEEAAAITGRVFGVHGEHVFEYGMKTTSGVQDEWTPEKLQARLSDIERFGAPPAATPAAVPVTDDDPIASSFERMPLGFLPEKAKGWSATMHFEIEGAGDFTVSVKDGACTTAKGKDGSATCVVKTDKDTFLGMLDGTVDGQQAFMAGKVSATNLADMMKYKGAFSKEAAEKALTTTSTPAKVTKSVSIAISDEDKLAWLRAGGARDLDVPGVTFELGDEEIVFDGGHKRVRTDRDTLLSLLSGELDLKEAVVQMKLVTDGVRELQGLKLALEAAGWEKLVADSLADRPVKIAAGYAEKVFHGKAVVIAREHADLYAKATDDERAAYTEGEWPLAPPLVAVRYHHELAKQALTDGGIELDLLRLVFGEQAVTVHKPLRVGDVLSPKAQLDSVEHKDSGSVLKYRFSLWREGELVNETVSTYFVRGKAKSKKGEKKTGAAHEFDRELQFTVREGITHDYAEASLDDNPIHVNPDIAKAAGFEGVINHGLNTLALTARELITGYGDGDPAKLRSLSARFAKPVYPGQTLTARVRSGEDLAFDVVNEAGEVVLTQGRASI